MKNHRFFPLTFVAKYFGDSMDEKRKCSDRKNEKKQVHGCCAGIREKKYKYLTRALFPWEDLHIVPRKGTASTHMRFQTDRAPVPVSTEKSGSACTCAFYR